LSSVRASFAFTAAADLDGNVQRIEHGNGADVA
jgi:hypothetical protein